jgi:6-phosphofructokinase 1
MVKRVGILTGGGDCPGLNAVIRGAVRTLIREYKCEVIGIELGFEGLMQGRGYPMTLDTIRGILHKGGTLLRTSNRGNPFDYPSKDDPKVREDRSGECLENCRRMGIDALIAIGGEGTLKIADKMGDLGFPIVGVPKTIDNDVRHTDFSFGFQTAVAIATEAIDRLHTTAESHNRVMVLEVMGRHVGWIALHSGIAGGADIILIPEIPYNPEEIVKKIRTRQSRGQQFDIIVVAEGATRAGGGEVWADKGAKRLGGVAFQVAEEIGDLIDLEVRVTVLGHLQRGGSPVAIDRVWSTQYGNRAADFVAEGMWGMMTALQNGEIVPIPIKDAIGQLNMVSPDGPLIRTARALGISFADGR